MSCKLSKIIQRLLIFLLIFVWIYSGFPRIWQKPAFPPEIQEAQAATERQSPDGLLQQDNLTGTLADIDEDPDSPDANWLTYITNNVDTVTRVSFPTPTGNPTVGAGLQGFKIWVRKQPGTGTPTVAISLYENGALLAEIMAATSVTSTTGQLFSATWNASLLGTANGSLVECYIFGDAAGGAPATRATVEVGAVEWNVDYVVQDTDSAVEVHGGGAQSNFALDPLNDTAGEKFSVLKFQVRDTATTDTLSTLIDQITIPITGTGGNASTDIAWAELWDDTGGAQVATSTSITNSLITFGSTPDGGGTAGLDTVANGGTIRYTVNVYMKNSALTATNGQTYIFGINDSNVGTDTSTSSSQMRANASAVTNVTGTITVTHSKLTFTTQPPSSASTNTDFTGTIGVSGTDENGNIDTAFAESITISAVITVTHETPNGVLSSTDGLTRAATSGTATWTDTKYTYAETIDIKAVSGSFTEYSTAVTVSVAPAWTAYNDCADDQNSAYESTGNVTNFGAEDASGELIKYSDGTGTGVTLTYSGTSYTEGLGTDEQHGNPSYPATGDAVAEFGTIINMGKISYSNLGATNNMIVTLSGVSSTKTYTLVVLGMRGNNTYVRDSKYVLSGVTSFTNSSSGDTTKSTTSIFEDTTTYATGDNWSAGLVAKWTNIIPTSTSIVVTITAVDLVDDKGYLSAIKLSETGTVAAATISSAASQTFVVNQAATAISTITITDAATPTITAANDIYVIIPATFNMTWDTTDTAATIGGTASDKVSSTVSYVDHLGSSNSRKLKIDVTTDFAASDTLTIAGLSFTSFSAASSADNLELDTNKDGTADDTDDKTITIIGPTISSAANQSFAVGDSATAISTITITDASTATITATNDIRIKIPSTFNMTWDETDTTATIGGGAAAKVSTTVSYEDTNKTLVINVITDFAASDSITVSGLSFKNFSATSAADNLELEVANNGTTAAYDDKTITIISAISLVQQKDNRHAYLSPSTSITVTLDSAATAGNLLVTGIAIDKASGTITAPTGFTLIHKGEGGVSSGALAYKIAAGGETAITWNWTATEEGNAWVGEYSGTASSGVLDQSAENESYLSTATNSISTGTTGTTTQADELAIAFFAADSGNAVGSSRSWTNSFTTITEKPVPSESGNPFFNVASKTLTAIGTVETTISHNGSDECYATVATFKAAVAAAATISSAASQTFVVNQAATAISTITITDYTTPTITAANDIRIKIPSTFNMTWDETDTTATIGGGAAAKVSTTVSYEDTNKTLVINVTTDFAASDSIAISGLSFKNFTGASAADNLELETANDGSTVAYDDKTITIEGLSTTIAIRAQNYTTLVSNITFPEGVPGATVSQPYNNIDGSGSPQTFGGAGTAKPVVTLYNSGSGNLIIWYNITTFTNGIVSNEYYLVNNKAAACADADCITGSATFDADTTTGTTIDAGAGNEKDLYLKINLSAVAGKTGTSTLTILGETP